MRRGGAGRTCAPKVTDPNVREEVKQQPGRAAGRSQQRAGGLRTTAHVCGGAGPWTIDNGCLTPTMKIAGRPHRSRRGAGVDDAWYSKKGR